MTAESPASHDAAQPQEKSIVLVADDSRVMRVALTRILKDEYTVLEAEHGEDAWSKLTAEDGVQMVFSDLSMPELDGFGLLERIRNSDLERIREIPFIVITGNEDDEGVRKKALSRGATDFILKPFQSAEIKARAKAHVDHLRKLRAASAALEEQSTEDSVTGLANHRFFLQRAGESLSFAARQGMEVGLLLIQLDRWQALVREHGTELAGELLRGVSEELRGHVRHEDVLAHFGEGRFALLSPAADRSGARQLAGRILEAIRTRKAAHQGAAVGATASIGIAVCEGAAELRAADLLEQAERLLAKAIRNGGDTVVEDDYVRVQDEAAAASAADETVPPGSVDPAVRALRVELAEARQLAQARQLDLERMQASQAELGQRLEQLQAELESARSRSVDPAELESERQARAAAEGELEAARAEAMRLRGELEQAQAAAAEAEQARAAAQAQLAQLRAEADEAQRSADEHAARLESESRARQQAESELAKLKLQEVARREQEQRREEAARQQAARGWLARLLHCMRGTGK